MRGPKRYPEQYFGIFASFIRLHRVAHVSCNDLPNAETYPDQPIGYQIRLQGLLRREWSDWFEGLTITWEDNGDTLLTGLIVDQALLHGLLRKIRDLGMPLLSVTRLQTPKEEEK